MFFCKLLCLKGDLPHNTLVLASRYKDLKEQVGSPFKFYFKYNIHYIWICVFKFIILWPTANFMDRAENISYYVNFWSMDEINFRFCLLTWTCKAFQLTLVIFILVKFRSNFKYLASWHRSWNWSKTCLAFCVLSKWWQLSWSYLKRNQNKIASRLLLIPLLPNPVFFGQ